MNISNKIPSLDNCEIHDLFKKRFTREPMNEDEIMEYIKSSGINLNDKHPLFGTVGKGLVLQWANDARYGFRPFSDVHKLLLIVGKDTDDK